MHTLPFKDAASPSDRHFPNFICFWFPLRKTPASAFKKSIGLSEKCRRSRHLCHQIPSTRAMPSAFTAPPPVTARALCRIDLDLEFLQLAPNPSVVARTGGLDLVGCFPSSSTPGKRFLSLLLEAMLSSIWPVSPDSLCGLKQHRGAPLSHQPHSD